MTHYIYITRDLRKPNRLFYLWPSGKPVFQSGEYRGNDVQMLSRSDARTLLKPHIFRRLPQPGRCIRVGRSK